MPYTERGVAVVHKFETFDGYHHVNYGTFSEVPKKARIRTKRFRIWKRAGEFAVEQAQKMNLDTITVSAPKGRGVYRLVEKAVPGKEPRIILRKARAPRITKGRGVRITRKMPRLR